MIIINTLIEKIFAALITKILNEWIELAAVMGLVIIATLIGYTLPQRDCLKQNML